jgi:hypothetical protein
VSLAKRGETSIPNEAICAFGLIVNWSQDIGGHLEILDLEFFEDGELPWLTLRRGC